MARKITDVDILLQQEQDTEAQVLGTLGALDFASRTRARVTLLQSRWQACGLPAGDASQTLRAVSIRARDAITHAPGAPRSLAASRLSTPPDYHH